MRRPARERGMALLTVLLLVAVMAVVATALIDDVRFALRRAANAETTAQAQWYALGAEDLARVEIAHLTQVDPRRTPLTPEWNGRPLNFPIEEGAIQATLSDGQACFNLNSLVEGEGETLNARPQGAAQFTALARTLGVGAGATLAAAVTDWIDSDQTPVAGGAEDGAYAGGRRPYRTSGTLLAEVSELRAVRGFDSATYVTLRPHLCALPTTDLSPINVNTLTEAQAPLLVMLSGGALGEGAARQVIVRRPAEGWTDVNAFWAEPLMAAVSPSDALYDQVTVRTRFFALETRVTYADAEAVSTALLEAPLAGPVRTVARRWSLAE
ncbi:type II secretion system minor pseudopilin GspK [Brevundimonas lutea]|uniref:type II secretion system minor pseudopilin GspK n=1 Tax=Brevundimonas lutea TaxID=2293980 RepID=UPI000F035612|nr:type II secretion system minor pseudopilin GspK [Brevundimonas lutea]